MGTELSYSLTPLFCKHHRHRHLTPISLSNPFYHPMSRETCTIEANNGITLDARIFKPATTQQEEARATSLAIVLVHPYSVLGGCQGLMKGIARGLSNRGFLSVTFDMRGVGRSTGRASLTGSSEIRDIIAVCKWVCQNLAANRILLVGSSAGIIIFLFFMGNSTGVFLFW